MENEMRIEEMTNEVESYDEPVAVMDEIEEESDDSGIKTAIKVLAGAGAVTGLLLFLNRKKIEERKNEKAIKRLEKLGYVVSEPDEGDEEIEAEEVLDDECDSDESEE